MLGNASQNTIQDVEVEAVTDPGHLLTWAEQLGMNGFASWLAENPVAAAGLGLALLGAAAWVILALVRRYLLRFITTFVRQSPSAWDEVLLDREVFHRLSWAIPLLMVHQGLQLVPYLPDTLESLLQRLAIATLVLVMVRAFSALLAGLHEIYERYPMAKERPIKGYLQVVNILAYMLAAVYIIATLINESPLIFFSGLGAMTAILLLIFRDTLLSLVAGVQLTGNNLIRVGDWIEMPQFEADGDVVDIALNTVSVQNWDRTITVIPTHKFLEHSFKNWRGMTDSGGRRIKRAFNIDMGTIRFLDEQEIDRFGRFVLLREYVEEKKREIAAYNKEHCPDPEFIANARRMTNVGMLRAYLVRYLRQHPKIHQEMTFLVRQLQPTPAGLPIEVYVFSNDIAWANYEAIQADIFDHVLGIVPEFGLRVFQTPSGQDLATLARSFSQSPAATGDAARAVAAGGAAGAAEVPGVSRD